MHFGNAGLIDALVRESKANNEGPKLQHTAMLSGTAYESFAGKVGRWREEVSARVS